MQSENVCSDSGHILTSGVQLGFSVPTQWRRDRGGGEGGHSPPAALSRGRHFEGRKYGILKIGRFWQIDVCIAERVGS